MAKVLVVDDDPAFLKIAVMLIEKIGTRQYKCIAASSPSDALALLSSEAPECCVLDVRLDDDPYGHEQSDGVALFEAFKQQLSKTRVIFNSAYTDYEPEYLTRRGATGLLPKEFFAERIENALREAFYPRVLLVEDEEQFARMASAVLQTHCVKCVTVTGTSELRKRVQQCDFSTFDAIVADVILDADNRYHGWDVINQLPATYPRDSVFFLTGKDKSEIETHLDPSFRTRSSREELLGTTCHFSGIQVLDKGQQESWASAIVQACARAQN
jgi:CheY-like chemotaxis protein